MADLRKPFGGDDAEFEKAAKQIVQRAEESARRAAEATREIKRSGDEGAQAFEDALRREQAVERARAKVTGETELVDKKAADAIRQRTAASKEATSATDAETRALERQIAVLERQRAKAERSVTGMQRRLDEASTGAQATAGSGRNAAATDRRIAERQAELTRLDAQIAQKRAALPAPAATVGVRVSPALADELAYQQSILKSDAVDHPLARASIPRGAGTLRGTPEDLQAIAAEMQSSRAQLYRDNLANGIEEDRRMMQARLKAMDAFSARVAATAGQAAPSAPAMTQREWVTQRDTLRQSVTDTQGANQEAQRAAAQAEGRVKAAQTRLRNLRDTPDWKVSGADDEAALTRKITSAEAAVTRAQAKAAELQAAHRQAADAAQAAVNAERDFRRDVPRPAGNLEQQRQAPGPSVENVRARVASLEATIERQKADAAANPKLGPDSGVARLGNMDTNAALNHQRRLLAEMERVQAVDQRLGAYGPEPRPYTPLQPRARAGGGGRDVVARMAQDEARATEQAAQAQQRGEQIGSRASSNKASAAKRAAEYLERQNVAMRDAENAARGELAAAEIIERKAAAAQAAAAAVREQNRAMREAPAAAAAAAVNGGTTGLVLPTSVAGSNGATANVTTQAASSTSKLTAEQKAQKRAAEELQAAQAVVDRNTVNMAAAQDESRAAMNRALASAGALDQGLQKHGYLTSEFIKRATDGTASYREWGEQITGTAAKFGAWTLVSIPVFAALDAVRQLGSGAIASASAVNELQRYINNLDTGKAQGQLRRLSSENNVSLADATTAFAQGGRLRQNRGSQDLAFQTAQATLLMSKVGDMPVDQAGKATNAIAQGFGLQANQLLGVIDQIDQAQNNFNLSITDGAQGIARAAGAVRAAGGDFTETLRLVVTAQQATNATGEEIGTALRRSAGFIQRPRNQALLAGFGIDASRGFNSVFQQAMDLTGSGKVQGPDILRLATAMSSPQLAASIIAPMLSRPDIYAKTGDPRTGVTPDASAGAATRERAIQLGAISQQISAVGNSLQRLGSEVEQSGFANVLGLLVVSVRHVIDTLTSLLSILNILPGPLRSMVTGGAEIAGIVALARRSGVAGAFANRAPTLARVLQQDPEKEARKLIGAGLGEAQAFLLNDANRMTSRSASAARQMVSARSIADEFRNRSDYGGMSDEAVLKHQAGLDEQYELAKRRAQQMALEAESVRDELAKAVGDVAEFDAAMKQAGFQARTWATERGIFLPPTLDRPTHEEVLPATEALAAARILPRTAPEGNGPLSNYAAGAAAAHSVAGATVAAGRDAEELAAAARGAEVGAVVTTGKLARAAGAMRGFGAAALGLGRGLLELFGPIGLLITGLSFAPQVIDAIKAHKAASDKQLRDLRKIPKNNAEYQQQLAAARKELADAGPALHGGGRTHPVGAVGDPSPQHQAALDVVNRRIGAGFTEDIKSNRDRALRLATSHKQVQDILDRAEEQFKHSFEALHPNIKGNRNAVQAALIGNVGTGAFASAPDQRTVLADDARTDTNQFAADVKTNADAISHYGLSNARLNYALRAAQAGYRQAANEVDPAKQGALLQAADAAMSSIVDGINTRLQDALKLSTNEGQRSAAFAAAAASAHRVGAEARRAAGIDNSQLADAKRRAADARQQLAKDQAAAQGTPLVAGLQGGAFSDVGPLMGQGGLSRSPAAARADADNKALDKLRKRVADLKKRLKTDSDTVQAAERQQRLLEADIRLARVQDYQAGLQLGVDAANAADRDPVDAAKRGLAMWQQIVKRARNLGVKGRDLQTLLNSQQQAANAVGDAQLSDIESQTAYDVSKANTPAGERAANLAGLRRELAAAQHPSSGAVDPQKVRDIKTQINNLNKQNQGSAEDAINARYQLLESTVDPGDTVRIAQLEARRAAEVVRKGGLTGNALTNARAEANRTRLAATQAVQNEFVHHLEFLTSIGQMTQDQERAALQRYLDRHKNLQRTNRQLWESIQQTIHGIDQQNAGQFDVNPANIRLPSLTEIRHVIQGGASGVTQNSTTTVNVTVNGASDRELARVGRVLERHVNGAGRAIARAGGTR